MSQEPELSEKRFTDLYRRYARESTDAPDDYHRVIAYILMACVANKNIWFKYGHLKLYPNLYVLLVGPSATNRKSWSMDLGMRLVEKIYSEYEIMDCSSYESFVAEFAREDRIPADCGILVWDELSAMMGRMEKKSHFEGFKQCLTSSYTHKRIRRRRGINEKESVRYEIPEPYLNILTGCSMDWVTKYIQGSDVTGGFLARFLWVICNENTSKFRALPVPVNEEIKNILINKLDSMSMIQGEVKFDEKGDAEYRQWAEEFQKIHRGGFWDALYDRLNQMVIKLAMMNALQRRELEVQAGAEREGGLTMTVKDVVEAYYLVEDLTPGLSEIVIGEDRSDILFKRLCGWVVRKKVHECRRSDPMNLVRGINAYWMDQLEKTLIDRELLKIGKPNGYPGKLYEFNLPKIKTIMQS